MALSQYLNINCTHRLIQDYAQILFERKRADSLADDLKLSKEQYVQLQSNLEQEEEAITNKLMKRLDQLKREKSEVSACKACCCSLAESLSFR